MTLSFDELDVGRRITTPSRTVTEADVTNFAGVSGDFNPIHTSATEAAESDFGERVAHGALVFSMMTGLVRRAGDRRADVVAFYGVDRLRFTAPVEFGDTIRVEMELVETEPKEHPTASGVVRYDAEVLNQRDETVLSCELLSLVK
ncbi:MaoC family dehydratase N-terminal domain-containing protein [Halorussus gelatinilyticus]|uniref:MaoC family dehydratase N-terminal domain-containing protein n=1 Tax=Halorussus gelatinilyticus TaxID=2937524 RepID=A0A8U0IDQ7_9EURY|nr:MaoC/PaaZ C-terminal domain-containing protein [Halorussus gelatinilyticus]UPV98904.1 MaoC family dehydratase N-terminal domain-containing protein [Halorussus gelatinilyticus]